MNPRTIAIGDIHGCSAFKRRPRFRSASESHREAERFDLALHTEDGRGFQYLAAGVKHLTSKKGPAAVVAIAVSKPVRG